MIMRFNSVNVKLLAIIIIAFLITTISIALVANRQLTNIMDQSQTVIYTERIQSIMDVLDEENQTLQQTVQQLNSFDEEVFQDYTVSSFRSIYYTTDEPVIYPFIIDGEGTVVMHPELAQGDSSLASLDFIQQATRQKQGELAGYEYEGQTKWMIFEYFEPWDWIVGYTIPLEVKYASVTRFRDILLLTMSLLTAIVVIGVTIVMIRFTRPIINLTKAASEIAAGNLDFPIKVPQRRDEIGILARSFFEMRSSIQQQITELNAEIEKRTQADLALQESEARYSQVIASINAHIYVSETDQNGIFRSHYLSDNIETLTGYPLENFNNGWDFWLSTVVHPTDRALAEAQLRELSPGQDSEIEYRLVKANGEEIWVRDSARVEQKDGAITTFGVVNDITEHKLLDIEREKINDEIIQAQRQALQELSTPVIPVMKNIIVVPLIGSIDSARARDVTRRLLAGISEHNAKFVILDVTGVPLVDTGVVNHLNKAIQAAKLKGTRVFVTGISDAIAETIVDLGIDWRGIETLTDLQTGLIRALNSFGMELSKRGK